MPLGQNVTKPTMVMDNVTNATAGEYHTAAITESAELWTWGFNELGQLGNGEATESGAPTMAMTGIESVSCGKAHTVAVGLDHVLWTWGWNDKGQLGNSNIEAIGYNAYVAEPTPIIHEVMMASAGADHTVFIGTNGSLWACGSNSSGQLGFGEIRVGPAEQLIVNCPDPLPLYLAYDAVHFPDHNQIQYTQAVYMLAANDIIYGMDDGLFHPDSSLTRAQACAIISRALFPNGVEIVPENFTTFSDVPETSWAWGVITICLTYGLVNGMGDGTFHPDETLTGTQLAKIVLCAIGYDAKESGLEGRDWADNVQNLFAEENLAEGLQDFDLSRAVSREEACQIVYNAFMR